MRYVIIGSSAAGINAAREIRKIDHEGKIIMITKDETIYSRCILHHYLGGRRTLEQLNFAEKDFETRYNINILWGTACQSIQTEDRYVLCDNGEEIPYDRLLIASGSGTFYPHPDLKGLSNVLGFRNIEDMEIIRQAAAKCQNIIVIGAGLVGFDAVSGLLELGAVPTMIDLADRALSRQLDERAASTYEEAFRSKGVEQIYGAAIDQVLKNDQKEITGVVLCDGRQLPCDFLILTAGIRANVSFLEGSGLATDKLGLLFDESGRTNIEDVYGAGDVSGKSPIWPAAVKQGIIAGSNMAGKPCLLEDFFTSKSTMNFQGIATMSLGNPNPQDDTFITETEQTSHSYKKLVHKDGKIAGAILQGDLSYSGILQQLIANRIDVSKVKKSLFDIDYSDFFNIDVNFEYFYEKA